MPKPPLPVEVEALLARPSHAVIASSRPDGQPVSVATWYLYENQRILVNMEPTCSSGWQPPRDAWPTCARTPGSV